MKDYPLSRSETKHLQLDKDYIKIFAHYGYIYCMLLLRGIVTDDPKEEVLVSGGGDGAIKLWTLDKKAGAITELFQLGDATGDSVLSLALDGTFLIGGMIEGKINIWDLDTRQIVRVLRTNVTDVLALSVGGGCLFAAGANGKIEVCVARTLLRAILTYIDIQFAVRAQQPLYGPSPRPHSGIGNSEGPQHAGLPDWSER